MDALPRETFSIINPTIDDLATHFDVNSVGALYDINPKHKDTMLTRFKAVSDYIYSSEKPYKILSVHYFKEIKGLYFHISNQELEQQMFGGFKGNERARKLCGITAISEKNVVDFLNREYENLAKKNEVFKDIVNIDDVFYTECWTGERVGELCFFQVVGFKGKKTALLREIKKEDFGARYQFYEYITTKVKPILNEFVSDEIHQQQLEWLDINKSRIVTKNKMGYYGIGMKLEEFEFEEGITYCYTTG